jgi:mRNA-degrading endonuclease RelE of RelBE toxin-antitoxin system
MYRLEFITEAIEDLDALRAFDLRRILEETEIQLSHEPARETRNRKRLRPNGLAEWELRVEAFRVFYDVLEEEILVRVIAVG